MKVRTLCATTSFLLWRFGGPDLGRPTYSKPNPVTGPSTVRFRLIVADCATVIPSACVLSQRPFELRPSRKPFQQPVSPAHLRSRRKHRATGQRSAYRRA